LTLAGLIAQFAVCALLIAFGGFALCRSSDRLAEMHGWSRGWTGLALLATVTSLPELASGISAVALVDAPNLAVGNALGACVVNLGFLVVVDLLNRDPPMYRAAKPMHLLSAGFGVVMLGFVAMSLLVGTRAPAVLHVGLYSPVLLALYLLALRAVYAHEHPAAAAGDPRHPAVALPAAARRGARREWLRFGAAAAVVIAAGSWLPSLAGSLADASGLSRSFVGTVLMALVTTAPEMAVTVAALRLGALDMAIGNLLGSNLFNALILAVDDAFYTRGPLLLDVTPLHTATAVTAVIMSGMVIIGLVMRPQGRVLRVASWVSIGLAAAFVINATLAYLTSSP